MTHLCISEIITFASDNGLSPGRRQAIIWTNAGILLIRPLGTNFNEILIEIHTFSFKKVHLKMSSGKLRPFCLGLNVLTVLKVHIPYLDWPLSVQPILPSEIGHMQYTTNNPKYLHGKQYFFFFTELLNIDLSYYHSFIITLNHVWLMGTMPP